MLDDSRALSWRAPDRADSRLQLLDWRPLRQNTLRGFATVRLYPPGLIIHDLTVHRSSESLFALMPGKAMIGLDGHVLTDERGRRRYAPVIEVPDRTVRERLSAALVALIQSRDPEALT